MSDSPEKLGAALHEQSPAVERDFCAESTEPIVVRYYPKLAPLDHRPFFLTDAILISSIVINLGWISWLCVAITRPLWQGPKFVLDGGFSGYVATFTKSVILGQVFAIGKIMPYRNMLWTTGPNMKSTIDSDYWPYQWPILRFRAMRNGDYFFQGMDIAGFFFTGAVVQFESNLMRQVFADAEPYEFLGYAPNHGIIVIALVCHAAFVIMQSATVVWLNYKGTGLLADPGSLAFYMALFSPYGDEIKQDFELLEDEDRRWNVRHYLKNFQYRIGYWEKNGKAVYGIKRIKGASPLNPNKYGGRRKPSDYPEFHYVPWFLETRWSIIWISVLSSSLAILSTLVIRDSILTSGFSPHASTNITSFVKTSPASFLWSFFPSFTAEVFETLVLSIDTFHRMVQPYSDLRRKSASRESVINAFSINYMNDLPIIVTYKALSNKHWRVAITSILSLISTFVPATAANMFYVDDNERIAVQLHYFWTVVAYMIFLIFFLLFLIPDQSRYMPRDLETIADHMALFSQSSLLDGRVSISEDSLGERENVVQTCTMAAIKNAGKSALHAVSSFPSTLNCFGISDGIDALNAFGKLIVGPPKLVEKVAEQLVGGENTPLPRFGLWKKGGGWLVTIDCEGEGE